MRLLVFGASGRTGRLVVEEALKTGHQVVAFVRNPSRLALSHPQLTVMPGDVTSSADVDLAVRSCDAVVSVLGLAPNSPANVCSLGVANIVGSMSKYGVRRLICLSDYGNGETRTGGLYARFLWLVLRAHLEDKEKMEAAVRSSGLEWTIVRATILTTGARKGKYRAGPEIKVGLFPRVSRSDVADFIVKQVTDASFVRASPSISH
jgi:uncharacterized protein YbjT (DUF2867 family)